MLAFLVVKKAWASSRAMLLGPRAVSVGDVWDQSLLDKTFLDVMRQSPCVKRQAAGRDHPGKRVTAELARAAPLGVKTLSVGKPPDL